MNAKVKFPEQLIPFYSVADIISAYSLASETATQLRTLLKQIIKATIFVKTYAEEHNLDNSTFIEIENLIAISLQLSNSHADTCNAEIKRHRKAPHDQYDAGDLSDAYALAHENTTWLETLISKIRIEVKLIKEAVKDVIHSSVFATLENLINIAEYFAEINVNTFSIESEKYEAEWEISKNG